MTDEERRIQSCIDHINSAIDVDPWAKTLATGALGKLIPEKPEPITPTLHPAGLYMWQCGNCKWSITRKTNFCPNCGKEMLWDD